MSEPTASNLPCLGEAFAVELANTLYRDGDRVIDFLEADLADAWWKHVSDVAPPVDLDGSAALGSDEAAHLRVVRDATRALLEQASDVAVNQDASTAGWSDSEERRCAVEVLERAAAAVPARLVLDWRSDQPQWVIRRDAEGGPGKGLAAAAATECILFIGSDEIAKVRRCARPGCSMLFMQGHRSRRFCHASCAHRVRQAKYEMSRRLPGADPR